MAGQFRNQNSRIYLCYFRIELAASLAINLCLWYLNFDEYIQSDSSSIFFHSCNWIINKFSCGCHRLIVLPSVHEKLHMLLKNYEPFFMSAKLGEKSARGCQCQLFWGYPIVFQYLLIYYVYCFQSLRLFFVVIAPHFIDWINFAFCYLYNVPLDKLHLCVILPEFVSKIFTFLILEIVSCVFVGLPSA